MTSIKLKIEQLSIIQFEPVFLVEASKIKIPASGHKKVSLNGIHYRYEDAMIQDWTRCGETYEHFDIHAGFVFNPMFWKEFTQYFTLFLYLKLETGEYRRIAIQKSQCNCEDSWVAFVAYGQYSTIPKTKTRIRALISQAVHEETFKTCSSCSADISPVQYIYKRVKMSSYMSRMSVGDSDQDSGS